jgi:hypothetical protein
MATTYTWLIQELKAKVQDEDSGLENVITTIHWRYRGEAGEHSHELYGTMNLEAPEADAFIAWDDLKGDKETVISWLENGLDVESLHANIAKVIELKAKPREITLHLDAE